METQAHSTEEAVAAASSPWREAFVAVGETRDFAPLSRLLDHTETEAPGINACFDFEGRSLTPLFVAVLLGLEDLLPRLLALGADPALLCFYEGLLCAPLHAAALRSDVAALSHLLDFLGPGGAAAVKADSSSLGHAGVVAVQDTEQITGANAVQILVARDVWSEEVYRLLLSHGVPISTPFKFQDGRETSGLLLPRLFSNKEATEERIDSVLGEEVKTMIRNARFANELNTFLEVCSDLKLKHGIKSYRCTKDIDFCLSGTAAARPLLGQDEEATAALLYAADVGNSEALRLLLYAGADVTRPVQRVLPFDAHRAITLPLTVVHLALLRGDIAVIDNLLFFGVSPGTTCSGDVHHAPAGGPGAASVSVGEVQEHWDGLGLLHIALLHRNSENIGDLLKRDCDINLRATRTVTAKGGPVEEFTPLRLAVLLSEVRCTSRLLDCGAEVTEVIRADACAIPAVCEMFGGPSVVGLEEWVSALLTGETALQQLIDRRTDLSRVLCWPEESPAALLERHRLASPALIAGLVKSLTEVPTTLRGIRPAHLACLLQQPWAVAMLADAGVSVADAAPCCEAPCSETGLDPASGLGSMQLDAISLTARVGGLKVMELLRSDQRFAMDVNREIPLAPDITPPFFPQRDTQLAPTWAWKRLGPLELALLHRRVDMAVLLVRLGADLLHTVDHVAILPPSHYSVTDMCFRGLTPLHLCALLDLGAATAALLNEACKDGEAVVENEFTRAQRQAMLSAVCVQAWATVETDGCPEKEPWLWRDLTPLHLALLRKNYAVAELLIDVSTAETLGRLCVSKDVSGDTERSFSALLLAYEQNQKDIHRRIAKKFPTC